MTFTGANFELSPYGSFVSGIQTPFSDIDLSIKSNCLLDKEKSIEMLTLLAENLKICKFIKKCQPILTAAIPIIKIQADSNESFENFESTENSHLINLDIVLDSGSNLGFQSTSYRTT